MGSKGRWRRFWMLALLGGLLSGILACQTEDVASVDPTSQPTKAVPPTDSDRPQAERPSSAEGIAKAPDRPAAEPPTVGCERAYEDFKRHALDGSEEAHKELARQMLSTLKGKILKSCENKQLDPVCLSAAKSFQELVSVCGLK